jgi:hypothetical protein
VSGEQFAVLQHTRWLETDEPRATVIRSRDGFMWHEMCTTDPDTAEEIAEALTYVEEDRAERRKQDDEGWQEARRSAEDHADNRSALIDAHHVLTSEDK